MCISCSIVACIDCVLDVANAFGLLVRYPEDPQERLLAFKVLGDEKIKNDAITMLAELLAKTNFTTISVSHYVAGRIGYIQIWPELCSLVCYIVSISIYFIGKGSFTYFVRRFGSEK